MFARIRRLLLIALLAPAGMRSQPAAASLKITVQDSDGWTLSRGTVRLATASGSYVDLPISDGTTTASIPFGRYCASVLNQRVPADACACFEVSRADLLNFRLVVEAGRQSPRGAACGFGLYPASYSIGDLALANQPTAIPYPLGWGGAVRPKLVSFGAFSWAATRFAIDGVNSTDPYDSGIAMIEAPPEFLQSLTQHSPGDPGSTRFHGPELNADLRSAESVWHGRIALLHGGLGLSWNNLPRSSGQHVFNSDRFRRLDRDTVELGGPLTRKSTLLLGVTGQFASQTVPWSDAPDTLSTRSGSFLARSIVHVSSSALSFALLASGYQQPRWSTPPGFTVYSSYGLAPVLSRVAGESSADRAIRLEAGSSTPVRLGAARGVLEARAAFTRSTDRNKSVDGGAARLNLEDGILAAGTPFTGSATRRSAAFETVLSVSARKSAQTGNDFQVGSSVEATGWRNLVGVPGGEHLWDAASTPALIVQFNRTSFDTKGSGINSTAFVRDRLTFGAHLSIDTALVLSQATIGAPSLLNGDPGRISWFFPSPRLGLTVAAPHLNRLVFRASVSRTAQPLSGRLLDFQNPAAISGRVYQWDDRNGDALLQSGEQGNLLRRFGGAYSLPSGKLATPYADHIRTSATLVLPLGASLSLTGFRTDEKRRIALENVGVPFTAYNPVWIRDPGADFIPFSWDDQQILVFAQREETLGSDTYRLTNPPGLRAATLGLVFELSAATSRLAWRASYTKMKSFSPSNPGDSPWSNDSETIGALYLSPNDLYQATGHTFFDRANVGHLAAHWNAPFRHAPSIGLLATYFDGAPFGRELLVTGLPQGPFLAAATLRGSPEGGHRTQFLLNIDVRLSQEFRLPRGRVQVFGDCVNLLNAGNKIAESDVSGPNFNLRLPLAVQPSRSLRVGLLYWF